MSDFTFELDEFAEKEFYKIVAYYKQFDQELSSDFIKEFDQSVEQLLTYPKAGNPYLHDTRRVIFDRFPYAIVYKIYNADIIIAHAIMHLKRQPDYWQERL
jgi:plasmid stabilization system protein ParE